MSKKVTINEILLNRNEIFIKKGVPVLFKNGFKKSPFSTGNYGKESYGYCYEHWKLLPNSLCVRLGTFIMRGDVWIQSYLKIFKLSPEVECLSKLSEIDGTNFAVDIMSENDMRLKVDGYKVIPIIHDLYTKHHKIGCFWSRSGYEKRISEMGELIELDFNNIDSFIDLWLKNYTPIITDWEGKQKPF
jgi:hypothetical protein